MAARLLELLIYILSGLIVVILGWAILRSILLRLEVLRQNKRNREIETGLKEWLKNSSPDSRKKMVQKLKKIGAPPVLEPLFFDLFEHVSKEEQNELRSLFELLGLQNLLRNILKESSDILKREKAVLKLAKMGVVEDIPFLLNIFHDSEEEDRVKQCCVQAIYDLSDALLSDPKAVKNLGLLVQLLDLPNGELQEYIAKHLAALPVPKEDIVPHLLRLETETAKEGILMIFDQWNNPEHAPFLYDYLDDSSSAVRRKTIHLLGRWKDQKSVVLLLNKLDDPSEIVRLETIEALGHLNHPGIRSALRRHLKDPSSVVQIRIYFLLVFFKESASFEELIHRIQDPVFRKTLFLEFAHLLKNQLVAFLEFLGMDYKIYSNRFDWNKTDDFYEIFVLTAKESQNSDLRKKALLALSLWENKNVLEVIAEVSRVDPDPVNRVYAEKILENLKQKEAAYGR